MEAVRRNPLQFERSSFEIAQNCYCLSGLRTRSAVVDAAEFGSRKHSIAADAAAAAGIAVVETNWHLLVPTNVHRNYLLGMDSNWVMMAVDAVVVD